MRIKAFIALAAAGLSLGACATDRYGYNRYDQYGDRSRQTESAATGVAVGAAAGAGIGAVVDGVSPVEGAIAGGIVGGVIGAVSDNNRRWIRDNRGYCYYVTERGEARYDYNRRC